MQCCEKTRAKRSASHLTKLAPTPGIFSGTICAFPCAVELDQGPGSARDLVEGMLRPLETRVILEHALHHPWVTSDASGSLREAAASHTITPSLVPSLPCALDYSPLSVHEASGTEGSEIRTKSLSQTRSSQSGAGASLQGHFEPRNEGSTDALTHKHTHACAANMAESSGQECSGRVRRGGCGGRALLQMPVADRKALLQDISDLVVVATEPARSPLQPQ